MAERANKIYILTDSSKFTNVGVATLFMADEVDVVITDENVPQKSSEYLKKHDVDLFIV